MMKTGQIKRFENKLMDPSKEIQISRMFTRVMRVSMGWVGG